MIDHEEQEDEDSENLLQGRYLSFNLGQDNYAIGIEYVTEIVGIQKIAAIPDMPEYIKGVMNLRGRVIPLMDVRLRFRMESRPYDERTCVVVIQIHNATVGLIVDAVNDVASIPNESISPAPKVGLNERAQFVQGIGKVGSEVKILLSLDHLIQVYAKDANLKAA